MGGSADMRKRIAPLVSQQQAKLGGEERLLTSVRALREGARDRQKQYKGELVSSQHSQRRRTKLPRLIRNQEFASSSILPLLLFSLFSVAQREMEERVCKRPLLLQETN